MLERWRLCAHGSSQAVLALSLVAFFNQFKPSEPFLVDFLIDDKGFSNKQVFDDLFNIYVYTQLPCIVFVGIASEVVGNRFVLQLCAVAGVATVLLTRFGAPRNLFTQQVTEVTVTFPLAIQYVLPSMLFAVLPPSRQQQGMHCLKAILLFSNAASALVGEILRDASFSLYLLFDLSLVGQVCCLLCSLLVPAPRARDAQDPEELVNDNVGPLDTVRELRPTANRSKCESIRLSLVDLALSLRLRSVIWWTAWSLAMEPVHSLVLTYWQSLERTQHTGDHNGYVLATLYLVSGMITLLSARGLCRSLTAVLVVSSILVSGCSIARLSMESHELLFYAWLLIYQCVFEVMSAVATYQMGDEVTSETSVSASRAVHHSKKWVKPSAPRLTFLFTSRRVFPGVAQTTLQKLSSTVSSLPHRFQGWGVGLVGYSALLLVVASVEAACVCCARRREHSCNALIPVPCGGAVTTAMLL